jgi:hypothetical protein
MHLWIGLGTEQSREILPSIRNFKLMLSNGRNGLDAVVRQRSKSCLASLPRHQRSRPKLACRHGRGVVVQLPGTGHSGIPQQGWLANVSDADVVVIWICDRLPLSCRTIDWIARQVTISGAGLTLKQGRRIAKDPN